MVEKLIRLPASRATAKFYTHASWVGWLGFGEKYNFFLQQIFCTADSFSATNFSQLWRENFGGKIKEI